MAGADKKKKEMEELLAIEEPGGTSETGDEGGEPENRGQDTEAPQAEKHGLASRIFKTARNRKWIIIFIMLPLGALTAVGLTMVPRGLEKEIAGTPVPGSNILPESVKEENLLPFFIPLSGDENLRLVRVDLSVIWPVLASVKYRKDELRIRDQMLDQIRFSARRKNNTDNVPGLIEDGLTGVLRNSLGIYTLEVKVREINYF